MCDSGIGIEVDSGGIGIKDFGIEVDSRGGIGIGIEADSEELESESTIPRKKFDSDSRFQNVVVFK